MTIQVSILIAVVTGFLGASTSAIAIAKWIGGALKERNLVRFQVGELSKEVSELKKDSEHHTTSLNTIQVKLATIQTSLEHLQRCE